jgi:hypothetical protein
LGGSAVHEGGSIRLRAVTKLFQTGAASQQAYTRAQSLWTYGPQETSYRPSNGAGWRPAYHNSTFRGPIGSGVGNGADRNGPRVPENPRYVATVGSWHFYLHDTVLDPARQWWPCPLLLKSPCETCSFLEYDRGGTPHCAAVLKLRIILDGADAGEDLNELRQWIRTHEPGQSRRTP